jgi:hypothetical protein
MIKNTKKFNNKNIVESFDSGLDTLIENMLNTNPDENYVLSQNALSLYQTLFDYIGKIIILFLIQYIFCKFSRKIYGLSVSKVLILTLCVVNKVF